MAILVTGAAGFIGSHLSHRLLARGEAVIGLDVVSDYYDVRLKEARLARLASQPGFTFLRVDIADRAAMAALAQAHPEITRIVNLAAQPGVRYSLENPRAYVDTNVVGFLEILELARGLKKLDHLVYASSSSVYGGNTKLPFAIEDPVDAPLSLYAATKKADELMGHCYSHLFRLPATGLRFFTVYGPWGRPDMSAFIFTKAILAGEPIPVFNNGEMKRDFTYIDDIVSGVVACLDRPPVDDGRTPPHRVYNIGNNRSEELLRFIRVIEQACGREAKIQFKPMQAGDVPETFADIEATRRDFDFVPTTAIDEGVPRFVEWYRDYYKA
ncbi:MAG TPA: NAD-dependent epimerase/dehydratase family protein [Aliidongia sp.]|uniref:NAD-dependent epimerase/dehydratase family protein n=1 Tax=Aliidongia sp. TaxID=1914230 RepID=UPI002DDCA5F7|nr:NAD-dependent epimerase/dehydratase family protein [Aliidongia sp.]HEV2674576.1 NAD-dependent epimerase/dehydratase family protein [Aliidongia sp.]